MLSRSQYTFGGGGLYQKKRKSGPKPKTAGQKTSKEKCDRDSRHKKQKNDILHSPTQSSNAIPNVTTVGPNLVLQEEASLQANIINAKALHA